MTNPELIPEKAGGNLPALSHGTALTEVENISLNPLFQPDLLEHLAGVIVCAYWFSFTRIFYATTSIHDVKVAALKDLSQLHSQALWHRPLAECVSFFWIVIRL